MRKKEWFFVILVGVLFLVACGDATGDAKKSMQKQVSSQKASAPTLAKAQQVAQKSPPPIPQLDMQCLSNTDSDETYTPYKEGYESSFDKKSLFIPGEIKGTDKKDYCEDTNVTEYYCKNAKTYDFKSFSCQEYCTGKACICSIGACRVVSQ